MGHLKKEYAWPFNLAYEIFGDDKQFKNILPEYLIEAVDADLSNRETKVIHLRFRVVMTYDEIAAYFRVTRERIRQILAKAIRKLRQPICAHKYIAIQKCEYDKLRYELMATKTYVEQLENSLHIPAEENPVTVTTFFSTPIEELELSLRPYNCLARRAHFKTYGDFQNYRIRDFMKIRNLGAKSLNEILCKLEAVGFKACNGDDIYRLTLWNDPGCDDVLVWQPDE